MRIHRRPAHIGREEHPVGSLAGCPGCQDYISRLATRTPRPNTLELALWLTLIALAIAAALRLG